MTHSGGIAVSTQLQEFLSTALTFSIRKLRLIKIVIDNEELIMHKYREATGTWEEDYDAAVTSVIKEAEPCYIFYRLDSQNEFGFEWLFIPFAPDIAGVRDKMLHAATRNTVKMEFGGGRIRDELFGTELSDVNLAGYRKHIASRNAGAPLTTQEEELALVKQMHSEVVEISARNNTKLLPGIAFPIDEDALTELQRLANKEVSHVQLAIDGAKEVIYLVQSANVAAHELVAAIPSDIPTYNFYMFSHSYEGDLLEPLVFISSMPSEKCSIREKMLYSSCKGPLLAGVREQFDMVIERKIDVTGDDEVDAAFLHSYLHPQERVEEQKFAKPKGPGGRGARRLIKTDAAEN